MEDTEDVFFLKKKYVSLLSLGLAQLKQNCDKCLPDNQGMIVFNFVRANVTLNSDFYLTKDGSVIGFTDPSIL